MLKHDKIFRFSCAMTTTNIYIIIIQYNSSIQLNILPFFLNNLIKTIPIKNFIRIFPPWLL
jgi:hypothetical protein